MDTLTSNMASASLATSSSSSLDYPYPNYPLEGTCVHLLNIFKDPSCPSAMGKEEEQHQQQEAALSPVAVGAIKKNQSSSFIEKTNSFFRRSSSSSSSSDSNCTDPKPKTVKTITTTRPKTPTALEISQTLSSSTIVSLTEKYDLDPQAFANMLVCYPNIKEEIVARYLQFFPGSGSGKKAKTDISRAMEHLDRSILYRAANSIIHYKDVVGPQEQGFFDYSGLAKDGSSVAYFNLENHNPKNRPSIETYIRSLVYSIEKEALRCGRNELMQTLLLVDRRSSTMKNQDLELIKAMFDNITFLYANSVPNIIVYPCNMPTRMFFNVLKPFLDKNIKESTKMLQNREEIEEYVEKSEMKESFRSG